jgi:UrcA family protein
MNQPITIKEKTMNTMTASIHLRRLVAVAILGASAAGFAAVSMAGDTVTRSVTVQYGDLDIANPQGAQTLYGRITRAAQQVCQMPEDGIGNLSQVFKCEHKAIADAVTKVGHPELIAVYNAKNRQPLPTLVARTR